MALRGIDISSWQDALVVRDMEGCDFVVAKATGGTGYDNPCLRAHADATLAAGKLLGCYHYARERGYQKDPKPPRPGSYRQLRHSREASPSCRSCHGCSGHNISAPYTC